MSADVARSAMMGTWSQICWQPSDLLTTHRQLSLSTLPERAIIGKAVIVVPETRTLLVGRVGVAGQDREGSKGLEAYAGAAPITRASGKTRSVTCRRVKNSRLNAAGYCWAFSALTASPGARAHYDRRRDDGDRHAAAQRNLFGRLLGCLWHCLITGQHYDETTAFPASMKLPAAGRLISQPATAAHPPRH
jgi:hypothetical protein